jgi:fructose-1,6-bisphosphatase
MARSIFASQDIVEVMVPILLQPTGDYIDRGPNSRQIIERLMDWKSDDLKLICLKGNHEDIMWQCCRQPIRAGWWRQIIVCYRRT